jgi:hypothetical protein
MSNIVIHILLIENLRESFPEAMWEYMPRKLAYRNLKHMTEQDFGYDADKWERWFEESERPIVNLSPLPPEIDEDRETRYDDNHFQPLYYL